MWQGKTMVWAAGLMVAFFVGWILAANKGATNMLPQAGAQQASTAVETVPRRPIRTVAPQPPSGNYTPGELANIHVYEMANASVVNINTSTVTYDRFFMLPNPGRGSGSGSVLDKEGHILTNFHVVEDANDIEVTLASGKAYPAEMVGYDGETDIAVLRIDAPPSELVPIRLGTSDDLRVGQRVYALGNPFGLSGTLTTGIISSLNRTPPDADRRGRSRALTSLIQTDAAMNPGNSGGPLLNTSAEVIGMNIAIATKVGQNAGVGFAIPASRIRRIVPELIRHGRVVRPYHGIVRVTVTEQGLQIVQLNEGSPAERAGLRGWRLVRRQRREGPVVYVREYRDTDYGDHILAINNRTVADDQQFLDIIEEFKPGDTVTLTILRDGRQQQVRLTLGEA